MRAPNSVRMALAWLATLVLAAAVVAQWQVNTQVGTRVNNRVGGELYGNMGSVKYASSQTRLLPSEERYAVWRSGALPSEISMNAAAGGPLPSNGVINYLPPPNPVQQAGRAPTPQLYNPAYRIDDRIDPGPVPMTGYGTIKYAPQATARPNEVPAPMISGALPSAQVTPSTITGKVEPRAPGTVTPQVNYTLRSAPSYVDQLSAPGQPMGSIRYASPSSALPTEK